MLSKFKQAWRAAPLATLVLVAAVAAGTFFAIRITTSWVYWNDPARQDQQIAGWMTLRYVGFSWDIPPYILADGLNIEREHARAESLEKIAEQSGVPVEQLIAQLEGMIAAHRNAAGDSGS